jgi:hypothetical protein
MQYILKVIIRIILLPCALILHLIPHIIGLTVNLYRWVKYGGEFVTYKGDDRAAMSKIYEEIKKQQDIPNDLIIEKYKKGWMDGFSEAQDFLNSLKTK